MVEMREITSEGDMMRLVNLEVAASELPRANRILVIGCSGGGKSTLSQHLSKRFDLRFISMDRDFYWLPGWVKREQEATRAMIADAVAGERWLMDGSGASSFDLRMPRANFIIWIRMPRWLCLWGVFSRSFRHMGRTRPEMAPGCRERFPDRQFLSFIWNFEKQTTPRILDGIRGLAPNCPVLVLKSRREMRALLELVRA